MNKILILATISRSVFGYTPGGTAVLEGTLAFTKEIVNTLSGELVKIPVFLPFQALGSVAERLQNTVSAGQNIVAEGYLNYEQWLRGEVKHSRIRVKLTGAQLAETDCPMLADKTHDGQVTRRMDGGFAAGHLRGNITADPVILETQGGKMVSFQVAVDETYRNKKGELVTQAHYLPVSLWREQAERFIRSGVGKGHRIQVSGDVANESWTTKEGEKRATVRLTGNTHAVIARKPAQSAKVQPAQQPAPQETAVQNAAPETAVMPTAAPEQAIPDMPF